MLQEYIAKGIKGRLIAIHNQVPEGGIIYGYFIFESSSSSVGNIAGNCACRKLHQLRHPEKAGCQPQIKTLSFPALTSWGQVLVCPLQNEKQESLRLVVIWRTNIDPKEI